MTDLFLPDRRIIKPLLSGQGRYPSMPEIDRHDPLARGLAFYCQFSGTTHDKEIVHNRIGSTAAAVNRVYALGVKRYSSQLLTNNYYEFPHHDDYNLNGDLTLFWSGVLESGGDHHLIGKHTGGGGSDNPFDLRTNSSRVLHIIRAGSTFAIMTGPTLSLDTFYTVFYRGYANPNTHGTWTVNGQHSTATRTRLGSNPSTPNTAPLRVGRRHDGAMQLNGLVCRVGGWNRYLPDAEINGLIRKPDRVLLP